ncbi:MAG: hypothetical protein K6G45_13005 [Lachnospiraceae bacterium]|nr:hypothetical protein [Lachnospiraceae bacterium]
MRYRVIDSFPLENNTAVAIEGDGEGLKNNIPINDGKYFLLSTGTVNTTQARITKRLMLVKGKFTDNEIYT